MKKPCSVLWRRASITAGAAALLLAASCPPSLLANPTGAQVVSGSVSVTSPSGGQMNIGQKTPNAIVNWNSFSIGPKESVVIAQPSASSALLNRVTGNDPSVIAGRLQANGKVFLVNPSGVIFAQGSVVNVGSMIASTLNIGDADFLAGNFHFVGASPGAVVNRGSLTAQGGGTIALLGGTVSNAGTVAARLGTVALGAGSDITLDFAGDGLTTLKINQGTANALLGNTGSLAADGGVVVMSAQSADALAGTVINQQGIVRAQSLTERNGHILLDGGRSGVAQLSGTLDATGGAGLTGGRIDATGFNVALLDGAHVDASGAAGGGKIRLGGGAGGADPDIRNANGVWMAPTADVRADALANGNGGNVVAFSNIVSRIYGMLSATGGPQGGDGGLIETSGHYLDTTGAKIDASAPKGKGGTWKLDPQNIDIVQAASGTPATETPGNSTTPTTFEPAGADSQVVSSLITTELNAGTSVTISTAASAGVGAQAGDILILTPIQKTATAANSSAAPTLTLSALGSITDAGQDITSLSGPLNVVLEANVNASTVGTGTVSLTTANVATGGGNFSIANNGPVSLTNSSITTLNGAVSISAASNQGPAAVIDGSSITTTSGNITLIGTSRAAVSSAASVDGVRIENSAGTEGQPSQISTNTGVISVFGSATGSNAYGVLLTDGSSIRSVNGNRIDLRGAVAGPTGTEGPTNQLFDYGVLILNGSVQAQGSGSSVLLTGSTNTADAGVAIGAVPLPSESGDNPGPVTITAGDRGSVILRASNDGSTSSLLSRSSTIDGSATIDAPNGTLVLAPASVDASNNFATTALDETTISLFGTGGGFNIDSSTVQTFATTLQTIVLGSSTHTGPITVNGQCPSGSTACTPPRPSFRTSLTLANPGSGSQGITLPFGLSLPGKTLTLASAGQVTDPGGIQAAGLMLAGPGAFLLTDPQNQIGVLSMVGAGSVDFQNSSGFVIGPVVSRTFNSTSSTVTTIDGTNSTLTGSLNAQAATGNIGLGGGAASPGGPTGGANTNLNAGGSIDLVMEGGVFTNAGSGTLSAGNAWRTWALTWNGETRGNVQPNSAQPNFYGCVFGSGCSWGGMVPATGNHFVYVDRPTLTVTADGKTRPIGAPNPPFTYTASGLINGDTAAGALSGSLSSAATPASPAGQYAIDPNFVSSAGYVVNNVAGTLTVEQLVPQPVAQSGLQIFFGNDERTFVYENNLQGTNICVGSNQPLFTTAPPGDTQDLLAVEWKRVRSQPNLNSCMVLTGQHGCGDF
ncbi:two-partner secretion domain-containing protein [Paraburkholderia kirstenboschensis]|uniref:Filamentous hemagglutinin N-terminal domain-containing protein n=1 Tax=Paraburkholderia kirstenboschensis TaxID=1245436 RepID=A0ABZ0EVF2_9BURK|nr:filamentous hemagglutinin N-terminal domain-containing protein [Paraburkholderia kirstenboschensis]WOD20093.1 filamentous hemagglutinin N-terminal domain-containing protein [Paraburkholderia kirstenboschensis]